MKLALEAGVSTSTVSRKLRQGKSRSQIIAEAEAWRQQQRQSHNSDGGEALFDAQRRKMIAIANLSELELATKRGQLVSLKEVNAWIAKTIERAKEVFLPISARISERIANESDPVAVQEIIDGEIRKALMKMSAPVVKDSILRGIR
jgi:hypothetical protein